MSSTQPPTNPSIEHWRADAVASLRRAQAAQSLRGTSEALEIPLDTPPTASPYERTARFSARAGDDNVAVITETDEADGDAAALLGHRRRGGGAGKEPLRRDSLKRREALLKGKEGSRRRQKWENDRLLGNPYLVPPTPSDYAPHPTHKTLPSVPYVLAPLWDDRVQALARAQRERDAETQRQRAARRGGAGYTATAVPKELRERLKRAKGAKGLLRDLEGQIREFVVAWEGQKREGAGGVGLGAAVAGVVLEDGDGKKQRSGKDEDGKSNSPPKDKKKTKRTTSSSSSTPAKKDKHKDKKRPGDAGTPTTSNDYDPNSSDEEIVFVGRNGSMKDVPRSPRTPHMSSSSEGDTDTDDGFEPVSPDMIKIRTPVKGGRGVSRQYSSTVRSGDIDIYNDNDAAKAKKQEDEEEEEKDKLLITSPLDDPTARFARYLVHALAAYYDLRAYSVTKDGKPKRREAYVGMKSGLGNPGLVEVEEKSMAMPTPLWGLV